MADELPLMVQAREVAICIRSAPFGSDVDLIHDALRAAVAAERERIAKWHDAQAEDNVNQWRQGRPDEMRPYAEAAATHTASAAAIRGDTKP